MGSTVIVDDNEDIANVLSDIVEIGGLKVVGVGYSGKEAVSLYSKYKPGRNIFVKLNGLGMDNLNGVLHIGSIDG